MSKKILIQSIPPLKYLGRKDSKDLRDLNYLIKDKLNLTPNVTVKYWDDSVWSGDQGQTSQCVGYAWAHWIEDGPVLHSGPHPKIQPLIIYNGAQQNDEWSGPPPVYDGTSVRGAAKWLKLQNKISSYLWAFDLQTLIDTVLTKGPVVVGTDWYNNMFYPDRNGFIKVTGYYVGGHAYDINGVDTVNKFFRIKNSWGKNWGKQGHAYISFTDMNRLIRLGGEVCLAIENTF